MKAIDQMTPREREHIIHDLEVEHRVAVVEAAKIKREMRQLAAALESKERRIQEIETGIALLR
ncbi:hypothetical protein KIY80_gp32 [Mycobacterium phage Benvolio]|uniref:Uncharacterized protein n=1 Tax=Mycobacterium phage Benvolio TaxID=2591074 RepID=A0A514A3K2_9CAUD|nr:hypothetical protein CH13_gp032 [Mycobacterium phage Echild]YP_010063469.1 hypothetical protein KIY80_gp32 [Mycobacterium phage Benvolio]AHG24253.1 hypothetical protein PBI_ECHILD_32 [Mycobacterium phage Echild]QDH47850.1 hypothetical protein SEA_BENVOLIO_32 [Mycobacterium phage Benvolio]